MTLVDFPLYNLDISTFVTDLEFLKQSGLETKYDLYAIINHYGTLHFGHYISIVKNPKDSKWYKYDDSSRSLVQEDQLQKEFAYILFYIRKDVQAKTLNDVYPNIKSFFQGKPIRTEEGEAFILQP
jgi:ubiquitin C-terminal hydrolase